MVDAQLRGFLSTNALIDPKVDVLDPLYLSSFSMVKAHGFSRCHKLAIENPHLTVHNCNIVALCALGKPNLHYCKTIGRIKNPHPLPNIGIHLSNNDWGLYLLEGIGVPLP